MERETGIEPATNSLEGCDSTTELLPRTSRLARLHHSRRSPVYALFAVLDSIGSKSRSREWQTSPAQSHVVQVLVDLLIADGAVHGQSPPEMQKTRARLQTASYLAPPRAATSGATGEPTVKNPGAQGRIRTSVARKERQIYSLLPLTTRPPVHVSTEHPALSSTS